MIVVDTNVIAYLMLPGDLTAAAEALLESEPNWAAPPLWKSEFRNILAGYMRRGTLSLQQSTEIQTAAEDLLAGNEFKLESKAILQLVAQSRCSAYDCEFVALAQQLECVLYTLDTKVLNAFPETAKSLPKPLPNP
jgi:predicted nucleic acid-binding protein